MLKYKDTWGSTQTRVNELIVTTKVKGGNVLTASVLKEAQRLDGLVSDHVHASSGLSEDAPEGEGRQPFGRTYGRSDLTLTLTLSLSLTLAPTLTPTLALP